MSDAAADATDALVRDLSRALSGRVSTLRLFDPNVRSGANAEADSPSSPAEAWKCVRARYRGRRVDIRANGTFVVVEVKGEFRPAPLSVNRVDVVMCTKPTGLRIGAGELPVFACDPADARAVVERTDLAELLATLARGPGDSVHIYRNAIWYYLHRAASRDAVVTALARVAIVAEMLDAGPEAAPPVRLPPAFAALTTLAQRWSIGDDADRSTAIAEAEKGDLRELVGTVVPVLPAVDRHLEAVDRGGEDEAALMALAQSALEAQRRLEESSS